MTWESIQNSFFSLLPRVPFPTDHICFFAYDHMPTTTSASLPTGLRPAPPRQVLSPNSLPGRSLSSSRPLSQRNLPWVSALKQVSLLPLTTHFIYLSLLLSICKYVFIWTVMCLIISPKDCNVLKVGDVSFFYSPFCPQHMAPTWVLKTSL